MAKGEVPAVAAASHEHHADNDEPCGVAAFKPTGKVLLFLPVDPWSDQIQQCPRKLIIGRTDGSQPITSVWLSVTGM